MTIGSFILTPVEAIIGVVILVVLAIGLFRFLLRLAWHLIGFVLTLAILAGIVLLIMNVIHF
jgi:hypothetical protein